MKLFFKSEKEDSIQFKDGPETSSDILTKEATQLENKHENMFHVTGHQGHAN